MTSRTDIPAADYAAELREVVEIVHEPTGAIVVCDTLAHCLACDDGLAEDADAIVTALWRGEFYQIGGGAAAGFTIRPAPVAAQRFAAA
jgi:hypothetical protein